MSPAKRQHSLIFCSLGLILGLASLIPESQGLRNQKQRLRYEIRHQWDSTPINHPNPAVVELSTTCDGDLRVTVQGTYFNSPRPEEKAQDVCPERPYFALWDYEVLV